jgi:hypothetical protein
MPVDLAMHMQLLREQMPVANSAVAGPVACNDSVHW